MRQPYPLPLAYLPLAKPRRRKLFRFAHRWLIQRQRDALHREITDLWGRYYGYLDAGHDGACDSIYAMIQAKQAVDAMLWLDLKALE